MIKRKFDIFYLLNLIFLIAFFSISPFVVNANSTCKITAIVGEDVFEIIAVEYGEIVNLNELFSSPNYVDDENEYVLLNWVNSYYEPITTFTANSDLTVYAHFKIEKRNFNVTFSFDNGTPDRVFTCRYGDFKTVDDFALLPPQKVGYTFDGWFIGGEPFQSVTVTEDIVIYAKYTENKVKPPTIDGESPTSDDEPKILTVAWSDELVFSGEIKHPKATLVGLTEGEECEFSYEIEEVDGKTGEYVCRVCGLTNSNYIVDENSACLLFTADSQKKREFNFLYIIVPLALIISAVTLIKLKK